jgi:hypothetical protein
MLVIISGKVALREMAASMYVICDVKIVTVFCRVTKEKFHI